MSELDLFFRVWAGITPFATLWGAYMLSRRKADLEALAGKAEKTDLAAVSTRLTAAEAKLIQVIKEMEHLPSRESSHRMEMTVQRLEGQLEVVIERLKPVARISERLQEFLLEQAGAKGK